ncbi:MAG: SDR family NAD(P)-dependent oxidoreductase [Vulcanimicrobiota bacterium]
MDLSLKDKVAIVTGSSKGLGFSIAGLMLAEGARVVINGRDEKVLEDARNKLAGREDKLMAVAGDVSEEKVAKGIVTRTLEKFGTIDILINNAGVALASTVSQTSLEDWNNCMKLNSTGVFLLTREVVKFMGKNRVPGSIVNVSSTAGLTGIAMACAYSAAKGAVVAFTKSLAKELAGMGINVNCVCPGAMDTDLFQKDTIDFLAEKYNMGREKLIQSTLDVIPLKRLLDPAEVADLVVYLASDRARGITGQAYSISCGMEIR